MVRAVTSQPPAKKFKADSSKSGQTQNKDSDAKQQNSSKGHQNSSGKDPRSDKCFKCDGVGHMK